MVKKSYSSIFNHLRQSEGNPTLPSDTPPTAKHFINLTVTKSPSVTQFKPRLFTFYAFGLTTWATPFRIEYSPQNGTIPPFFEGKEILNGSAMNSFYQLNSKHFSSQELECIPHDRPQQYTKEEFLY